MASPRSSYPRSSLIALPVARMELPGWGRLLRTLKVGGRDDPLWVDAPHAQIRGKYHGYWMDLDLRNWSERLTYFLGRFYELSTQQLMRAAVRPGDRFVDVGANIGMITLLAARLVGDRGRVDAFEPNPACADRVDAQLARNAIGWVTLHRCGLGDEPGRFTLTLASTHTGTGTLAPVAASDRTVEASEVAVTVALGDDELAADDRPVDFLKVDVEGFEPRALRGLRRTLDRSRPLVLTEVVASHLARAGSSVGELTGLMSGSGFEGFELRDVRRGLGAGVALRPLAGSAPSGDSDVLWVHPDGANAGRIRPLISA